MKLSFLNIFKWFTSFKFFKKNKDKDKPKYETLIIYDNLSLSLPLNVLEIKIDSPSLPVSDNFIY